MNPDNQSNASNFMQVISMPTKPAHHICHIDNIQLDLRFNKISESMSLVSSCHKLPFQHRQENTVDQCL